jgi:hypothetical protein
MSDWKEPTEDNETKLQLDSKQQLNETGIQSIRGVPPLSTEALGTIIDIRHLPVEQRPAAVADFQKTKEARQAAEFNGGVMRDGKGVYFVDTDGYTHEIPYMEDEKDEK